MSDQRPMSAAEALARRLSRPAPPKLQPDEEIEQLQRRIDELRSAKKKTNAGQWLAEALGVAPTEEHL